jgi:hypothetical protein
VRAGLLADPPVFTSAKQFEAAVRTVVRDCLRDCRKRSPEFQLATHAGERLDACLRPVAELLAASAAEMHAAATRAVVQRALEDPSEADDSPAKRRRMKRDASNKRASGSHHNGHHNGSHNGGHSATTPTVCDLLETRTRGWLPQLKHFLKQTPDIAALCINEAAHSDGEAALHKAARYGDNEICVAILRLHGINRNALTPSGLSALDVAAMAGHGATVAVLEAHGVLPGAVIDTLRITAASGDDGGGGGGGLSLDGGALFDGHAEPDYSDPHQYHQYQYQNHNQHHLLDGLSASMDSATLGHSTDFSLFDDDDDSAREQHQPAAQQRTATGSSVNRPQNKAKKAKNNCCHACRTSIVTHPREHVRCQQCPNAICRSCFSTRPWLGGSALAWDEAKKLSSAGQGSNSSQSSQSSSGFLCPACTGKCRCARCSVKKRASSSSSSQQGVGVELVETASSGQKKRFRESICENCTQSVPSRAGAVQCRRCSATLCANCSSSSSSSSFSSSSSSEGSQKQPNSHSHSNSSNGWMCTSCVAAEANGGSFARSSNDFPQLSRAGLPVARVPPRPVFHFNRQQRSQSVSSCTHPLVRFDSASPTPPAQGAGSAFSFDDDGEEHTGSVARRASFDSLLPVFPQNLSSQSNNGCPPVQLLSSPRAWRTGIQHDRNTADFLPANLWS